MYYCQQSFLHVREPSKIYSYFHIHIFLVVVFYSNKILASFIETYKTKQKRATLNIQDHIQPSWKEILSSGYYSEFSWDNGPKSLLSTLHCRVDGKLRSQTSSTMDADKMLFFLWSLTITSTAWHFQLPWKKRTQSYIPVFLLKQPNDTDSDNLDQLLSCNEQHKRITSELYYID